MMEINTINEWDIRIVHRNNKEIGKISFRELFRLVIENIKVEELKKEKKDDKI